MGSQRGEIHPVAMTCAPVFSSPEYVPIIMNCAEDTIWHCEELQTSQILIGIGLVEFINADNKGCDGHFEQVGAEHIV